ncbi:InlB B-repeat-containing protein [Bifidobacterium asteroides]|uniref:RCC1 domain-containing protein n=1 Tax=Bifidobacterium asteroides TaxID=1684 RepID=UPI003A7FD323
MRFDPADGSTPTPVSVKTGTLAAPPQQNPAREGFRFDGWTHDGQPFDFQTPILQDTTLKAQWSKTTDWTLSPDHGPATGTRLTISPPNPQEPQFASIHTAGEQTLGLTGDGRIYTWAQDGTTVQVPSPAQTSDGFHYLQVAAGSRWQAALGSDQHIYTWASGQAAPTIISPNQNARFTSISMNDDRLLAVDRQGRIHIYRANDADSQDLNPKFLEQAETSLPGKAQAVTAVASGSRILALDSDGQAWTWDASRTANVKPERIRQDQGMRITQTQALNQGFLLLDTNEQAYHLADSTTSAKAVNLPEGMKASQLTANKDQAIITSTDGRIWSWKPDETLIRADNREQPYTQAAAVGSSITAIDRQGSMLAWSLDEQGQPGKPAKLDTSNALTLESVSMDGQPLKFTKYSDSWQTDIPDRKPGEAAITITGRQDGQPFTRSLNYTVDQTLTRDDRQGMTHTVTFNANGGSPRPADQHFPAPNSRAKRPSPDPTRKGFLFDGWFIGQVAYDFSRPVDKDLTLTAKWTPESRNTKWSISPNKGSQLGRESTTIIPPENTTRGIRFSQVSGGKDYNSRFSLAVGSDGNAYAWGYNSSGQLGNGTKTSQTTPVMVRKPDRKTYPDLPADFTYVQVSAGGSHSLAVGSDGNAYAWGYNSSGQLGDGTKTSQTTPVMVRKPDRKTYPDLPADFTYVQVSAGERHSLALGSDGNAYAWGYNYYGQLGDGTTTTQITPVKVEKLADAPVDFTYVQVSGGGNHSLALGSNGNAYAWGYNGNGQLGNNETTDSSVPVLVRDPASPADKSKGLKATQVSAGYEHSLALGSDGYAYAWGWNRQGQLGDNTGGYGAYTTVPVHVRDPTNPTDTSKGLKATQVSAGYAHSLALGSDGYAYAWGNDNYGQLGDNTVGYGGYTTVPAYVRDPASPADKSKGLKATQVSAGYEHSLAIGAEWNAKAWGNNQYGQLGDNTDGYSTYKSVPVPVVFNLTPVITGVRFDQTPALSMTNGDSNSATVLTPEHLPATVTVSVDYTLGGAPQQPDTSLRYTYLSAGVLPRAGGEGILLALATSMTTMGGVLASRRHREETHQLLHASHE